MSLADRIGAIALVGVTLWGALVVAFASLDRLRTRATGWERLRSALRAVQRVLGDLEEELLSAAEGGEPRS